MLVLTRKVGEKIIIGENVIVTVAEIKGNKIRLAIEAPAHVNILRSELLQADPELEAKPAEWMEARLVGQD